MNSGDSSNVPVGQCAGGFDANDLGLVVNLAVDVAIEKWLTRTSDRGSFADASTQTDPEAPKEYSPTMLRQCCGIGIEKRIPMETWVGVFKHLYPSQLSRISQVCRTFYDVVIGLPIWPEMFDKVHQNNRDHLLQFSGGISLGSIRDSCDLMQYLCAQSFRICEQCLSVYKGSDVGNTRLASFPLPVHVWRLRAATKKIPFAPFSCKICPKDWVIRLCLTCRRDVFKQCPESIPEGLIAPVPFLLIREKYHLDHGDFTGPDSMSHHSPEKVILAAARAKFGGDIGFKASDEWSSRQAMSTLETRLEEFCRRRLIVAMDA